MQNPRDPNRDPRNVNEPVEGAPVDRTPVNRDPAERAPIDRDRVERTEVTREPVERTHVDREPVGRTREERYDTRPITGERYGSTMRPYELSDLVRWGPILAGFAATVATMLLLGILGAAIGITAVGQTDVGTFGAIWGGVSLILAFFVGGWIAARTAAVGGQLPAIVNSGIVWAFTLLFLMFLSALGAAGALGVAGMVEGLGVTGFAAADVELAGLGAWWTLAALLVSLAAAVVGGLVGMHRDSEFIRR
jgi:hypothetical protein